jgi:chromosome segregation ATPase
MEGQLSYYRQQVAIAEGELIDREAELADLKVETYAFRLEYDTRVGRRVAELEEVEAQIERCKKRIHEYRQWGPAGPPKTHSGETYVSVEEQYRRTWQRPKVPQPPPFPPPLNPATEIEIKKLYRRLCRRFHPDLTRDEVERAWRTEMMAAVNAAYAVQSLTELQALAKSPERFSPVEIRPAEQLLDALRTKLQQIRGRIREIAREIDDLRNSQIMEMSLRVKFARRKGQDLLAEMAADVEKDLERKKLELDFMVAQLKHLGIAHD